MRPRAAPPITGPGDDRRAVGKVDAHLGEEAELRSPLVVGPRQPDLAAVPAVGQDRAERVHPGAYQRRDVIRLYLEAVAVFGEPGSQLRIANPRPVQERLVDPVGSGIQPRAHDRDVRAARTHPRTSIAGRCPGGGCSEDSTGSIHSADQSPGSSSPTSNTSGVGPVALPEVRPHLYLPSNARPRAQGRPRVLDEHAVGALHPAGVPAVVAADPVGELSARALRKPPREARPTWCRSRPRR